MLSSPLLQTGWSHSPNNSVSRTLTGAEKVFVVLNNNFGHQSGPYLGATVSVKSPNSFTFSLSTLKYRAELAFQQTRWKYPVVACQISADDNKLVYPIQNDKNIEAWAGRTVHVVEEKEGWISVRERISMDNEWPTVDGDYCEVYLIHGPAADDGKIAGFDVLIRFHHAFVDGYGTRTILNEFLTAFADSKIEERNWGEEISRLYPSFLALLTEEEKEATVADIPSSDVLKDLGSMFTADDGLPLYRPDILTIKRENQGSTLIFHTFSSPDFLENLLQTCRKNNTKLTAVILASLFLVVYEFAPKKPAPNSTYEVMTAVDLRGTNKIVPPHTERNAYVFNAVMSEKIDVEVDLLKNASENQNKEEFQERFWKLVQPIAAQFAVMLDKVGFAGTQDNRTKLVMKELPRLLGNTKAPPPRPQTSPFYIADHPGSKNLDGSYSIADEEAAVLELDSYQLSTDQAMAKLAARSHSWKGLLTITLGFNAVRIPKFEVEKILSRWVDILEGLVE